MAPKRFSKRFSKNSKNDSAQSKQIAKNQRAIAKLKMAPEMKFRYLLSAIAAQAGGWNSFLLNNMGTGTDDQERIGNSVTAKHIYVSGLLINVTAGNVTTNVRMIVLEHKCAQGVVINPDELMQHTANDTQRVFSPYDNSFLGDYRIFSDEVITLSALEDSRHKHNYRRSVKLSRKVKYNGNGATIASIEGAAYYVLLCTEGANSVNAEIHATFTYTDS